jgi:hypothetical protein
MGSSAGELALLSREPCGGDYSRAPPFPFRPAKLAPPGSNRDDRQAFPSKHPSILAKHLTAGRTHRRPYHTADVPARPRCLPALGRFVGNKW